MKKTNTGVPDFRRAVKQAHPAFQGLSYRAILFVLVLILGISGCKKDAPTDLDEQIAALSLEALPALAYPDNNPTSAAKVNLGRLLFWDPIMGGEKDVACATCHHPDFAYTDGISLPIGVRGQGLGPNRSEGVGIDRVPRNSPSVLNTAYNGLLARAGNYVPENSPMFWDTRKRSLEEQCQAPPTSRSEMAGDAYHKDVAMDSVAARIANISGYVTLFDQIFGGGASSVTPENIALALATFERTLVTPNSPYDQYIAGNYNALTTQQKEGLLLFFGKARCGECHNGPMFSDWAHYKLGVKDNPLRVGGPDMGQDSLWFFRTPTLRNLTLTGPYMHSGMHDDLDQVMEYYNAGISENPLVTSVSPDFVPLGLSRNEIEAVISFLESLTDDNFDRTIPSSVPSGLPVGGDIAP